jgi:uncharacterized protein (DUF1786 family)
MNEDTPKEEREIYISTDDVAAIERFFKHFKINTSSEYNSALVAFTTTPDLETQKNYRFQLAKEIKAMKGQNALIDDLFKNVIDTSEQISYDYQFDKDLEDIVGVDSKSNLAASKP